MSLKFEVHGSPNKTLVRCPQRRRHGDRYRVQWDVEGAQDQGGGGKQEIRRLGESEPLVKRACIGGGIAGSRNRLRRAVIEGVGAAPFAGGIL